MVDKVTGRGIRGLEVVTSGLALDESYDAVVCNPSADMTIDLPSVDDVPNRFYTIRNISDYLITLSPHSLDGIEGDSDLILYEKDCAVEREFSAYDGTGGLDITSVQTVVFGNELVDHAPFDYNPATGILEVTRDGLYEVGFDLGTDITLGAARSGCEGYLEVDPGGGGSYAEQAGSRCSTYNRSLAAGEGSGSCRGLKLDLNAGDLLRVRALRVHGTDTTTTKVNASRFSARYLSRALESVTLLADVANNEWRIIGGV